MGLSGLVRYTLRKPESPVVAFLGEMLARISVEGEKCEYGAVVARERYIYRLAVVVFARARAFGSDKSNYSPPPPPRLVTRISSAPWSRHHHHHHGLQLHLEIPTRRRQGAVVLGVSRYPHHHHGWHDKAPSRSGRAGQADHGWSTR